MFVCTLVFSSCCVRADACGMAVWSACLSYPRRNGAFGIGQRDVLYTKSDLLFVRPGD